MLKSLSIRNYALIRELELEPSVNLNIITGETGAGKSIMLGAIGLLLGNRADTKVLFDQNEKCIIEGSFDISSYNLKNIFDEEELDYDKLCLIRREISPQNKSRAFVNDTPVNLDVLKRIGEKLMDIHSQHETLLLGDSDFQISILDAYAGNFNILSEYQELFSRHRKIRSDLEELIRNAEESRKQLDYNSFQLNDLKEANLEEGEQEKLEEDVKKLENSEEIKKKLNEALFILNNSESAITANLKDVYKILESLSSFSASLSQLKERLNSALIEIRDIAAELENEESDTDAGGERLEALHERLSRIYSLQKKHRVQTIRELLAIQNELEEKVSQALNLDDRISELQTAESKAFRDLLQKGRELSESRRSVISKITKELKALLKDVGIPDAALEIRQQETEPGKNGIDQISFLFSANKGVPPQELKNAASGGEFSRLMLCLKYIIASKVSLPTIVFDEIDTGISGEIAIKVGRMMKQMARGHQVIAISHLPQIAAQGDTHYFVFKDNTSQRAVSRIRKLSREERIKEIAQMIGGEKPSETALKSAKELLEID
jgi:DNA repair protein RecN (Recombination protein N)